MCQKLSHFSTRHFHNFFHQKNKKSNNFFVKTLGSTAVLCGLLHTFDGKSLKVMKTKRKLVLWKILPGLFSRIFSMFLFWKADWWSLRARQYSNSVSAREITRNYRWRYLLVYPTEISRSALYFLNLKVKIWGVLFKSCGHLSFK